MKILPLTLAFALSLVVSLSTAQAADLFIQVLKDGSVLVDGRPGTLEAARVKFNTVAANKPNADVLILADFDAPFERFVEVITEANLAGLTAVRSRMSPPPRDGQPAPSAPRPTPQPTPTTPTKPVDTSPSTTTPIVVPQPVTPAPSPAVEPAPEPRIDPEAEVAIISDPIPTPAPTTIPAQPAGPEVRPDPPVETINYATWNQFLKTVVDAETGRVDYQAARDNRATLNQLLALIAQPRQFTSPEQKIAFGINAYNALVIANLLDRAPMRRLDQVKGFYDQDSFTVLGQKMTLNQIRDALVRSGKDPRALTALVNGARSAPPLARSAYTADQLDAQLDEQARRFVNDPLRNNRIAGKIFISSIFQWYPNDFQVAPYDSAAGFIYTYSAPDTPLGTAIRSNQVPDIIYMTWDWGVNAAR